ncbi:hypothetical protein J1C82_08875 [Streptococcus sanguinis]|uniref:DUF6287 domain-containing protein n=1 Tax=Streptococcus sanguinis SK405 TaxID=888817 RepID=A0ABC9PB05_STRSA|nr:DUF6287 domain-containing protein [Streptococcus sanguinis]EGC23930.1 hypothetical protein HMPREF9390_1761 [Streptococcus sanguinis SK405]
MYKVLKVKDKKVYLGDERNNLKIIPFENFDFIPEIGDSIELFQKGDIIIPVLNLQNNSPKKEKEKYVFKNPLYLTIGILFLLVIGIVSFLFLSKQPETSKEAEKIAESTRIPKSNERSHSSSSKHQTQSDSNNSVSSTSTSDNRLAASQSESSSSLESREVTESTNISSSSENVSPLPKESYAAIVGTWRNANGNTLRIDSNGQVSLDGFVGTSKLENVYTLRGGGKSYGAGGVFVGYFAAGTSIEEAYYGYHDDKSDINRDRIISGQNLSSDRESQSIFYRVSE